MKKKCHFCDAPLANGRTFSCSRECATEHKSIPKRENSLKKPRSDSVPLRASPVRADSALASRKEIDDYKDLQAEAILLDVILDPLITITNDLRRRKETRHYAKELSKGIVAEATAFVEKLERRIEGNERAQQTLAATCLQLDHGIHLGEKIPFNHIGTKKSGHIRVEEVCIALVDSPVSFDDLRPSKDLYFVTGRRFKKNGMLGKIHERAYLQVKNITML